MKKFIFSLVALAVTFSAAALDFKSEGFIQPYIGSLCVSNKTLGVSNLLNSVAISGITGYAPTNAVGVVFTNVATGPLAALTTNNIGLGVFVTNGVFDTVNLFRDLVLTPRFDKFPMPIYYVGTNGPGVASALQPYQATDVNILISIVGTNAAANSAVTFVFDPLYDGTNVSTATAAEPFVVAVTANGTTPVVIATNVPTYRWPGVARIRLSAIANGDTDASSNIFVKKCHLNYWVP